MIYFTFFQDCDLCDKEIVQKRGHVPEDYVNAAAGSRRERAWRTGTAVGVGS